MTDEPDSPAPDEAPDADSEAADAAAVGAVARKLDRLDRSLRKRRKLADDDLVWVTFRSDLGPVVTEAIRRLGRPNFVIDADRRVPDGRFFVSERRIDYFVGGTPCQDDDAR